MLSPSQQARRIRDSYMSDRHNLVDLKIPKVMKLEKMEDEFRAGKLTQTLRGVTFDLIGQSKKRGGGVFGGERGVNILGERIQGRRRPDVLNALALIVQTAQLLKQTKKADAAYQRWRIAEAVEKIEKVSSNIDKIIHRLGPYQLEQLNILVGLKVGCAANLINAADVTGREPNIVENLNKAFDALGDAKKWNDILIKGLEDYAAQPNKKVSDAEVGRVIDSLKERQAVIIELKAEVSRQIKIADLKMTGDILGKKAKRHSHLAYGLEKRDYAGRLTQHTLAADYYRQEAEFYHQNGEEVLAKEARAKEAGQLNAAIGVVRESGKKSMPELLCALALSHINSREYPEAIRTVRELGLDMWNASNPVETNNNLTNAKSCLEKDDFKGAVTYLEALKAELEKKKTT